MRRLRQTASRSPLGRAPEMSRCAEESSMSSIPFRLARPVAGNQGVEVVILPDAVDTQVGAQESLASESGFFKQTHRALVVRNTGCLDPVQPQRFEAVRDE